MMFPFAGIGSIVSTFNNGDLKFWGNLFFSATITTSLATTFYFVATSKIGASKASSFIFLVPFSAALGSWIFLGETIEAHTIIGGLLGIAAVYILNKR
jgi:drug/metabolite transporter (DMT)-like permease